MSGVFLLDWAALAVSLFDTILLLWLGLTVLLNAERRSWGLWLAGAGLLMGGAFFISHTALLGHNSLLTQDLDFWWRLGWLPVTGLPYGWYLITLWYAGFWEQHDASLHRRHRFGLALTSVLVAAIYGVLIFTNAVPSLWQIAQFDLSASPSIGGFPLLIAAYPGYIVLCIGLALDALRRPGPSERLMGNLARERARPWLAAASLILLIVSFLVGAVIVRIGVDVRSPAMAAPTLRLTVTVARFDLVIASLIGVTVILLGQAIVSYEVFTGRTLPRRGLWRHWQRTVVLAGGYGGIVGWSLARHLHPSYSVLVTTAIMVTFFALLSWRSYAERESTFNLLRPFLAGSPMVDTLLTDTARADMTAPFEVLCRNVFEARVAYLASLGPMRPLVGPALTYPPGSIPPQLDTLAQQISSPETICIPVDPVEAAGARWAVPLWSEWGLIGVLLLGPKQGGGLYTQEEMEIARYSGARLLDAQASAEMGRRLVALQRQQMAHSQVLDQGARRTLHDDVLPQLHAALLTLGNAQDTTAERAANAIAMLSKAHRRVSNLLRDAPPPAPPELGALGLAGALQRAVTDELAPAFDAVRWEIEPEAENAARALLPFMAEVVFYAAREAVRNAARHGRPRTGRGPFQLTVGLHANGGIVLTVEDNGVGMRRNDGPDEESGHGLALHSTLMAVIGGVMTVDSAPDSYTCVTLSLPAGIVG